MKLIDHLPLKTNTMLRLCLFFAFAACLPLLDAFSADVPSVGLKSFSEGFTSPIALVPFPDGDGSMLVADQVGIISILSKSGVLKGQPYLALSDRLTKLNQGFDERGLLGLAVHPSYSENGKIYVYYSAPLRAGAPDDWDHTSRISEFTVRSDDAQRADMASERVILEFDEPYFNHDGGCLSFGPDGYLYIGSGDGGNANGVGRGHSPIGNSQDLSTLLGKILRVDINSGAPYAIPEDNPFSGENVRPEIYALGLRNPWRFSFDRGGSHDLIAADIGQTLYEEVNLIVKGGNYGWNVREGNYCFDPKNPKVSPENCPESDLQGRPFIGPILEYKNANGFRNDPEAKGISITGGYVYRGSAIPALKGAYVFADWTVNWAVPMGAVYYARPSVDGTAWSMNALPLQGKKDGKIQGYVTAFGEDADGELYLLTNGLNGLSQRKGKVYKLSPM
jgi:glucose/arabinose dehydrogenase